MQLAWALPLALLLAAPAFAAPDGPQVKQDTPYPQAREQLIHRGFDPVRIVYWPNMVGNKCTDEAYPAVCQAYGEVIWCRPTGGPGGCRFLFRRRADGSYWVVSAQGEPDSSRMKDLRTLRSRAVERATKEELDGYIVVLPNGRRFRFGTAPES